MADAVDQPARQIGLRQIGRRHFDPPEIFLPDDFACIEFHGRAFLLDAFVEGTPRKSHGEKDGDDADDGDKFAPDGLQKIDGPEDGHGGQKDPSRRTNERRKEGQCKYFWKPYGCFPLRRPDGEPRDDTDNGCVKRFRHDGGMPGGEFRIQSEKQASRDRRMEGETMGRVGLEGSVHDGGAGYAGHDDLQEDERKECMAAG